MLGTKTSRAISRVQSGNSAQYCARPSRHGRAGDSALGGRGRWCMVEGEGKKMMDLPKKRERERETSQTLLHQHQSDSPMGLFGMSHKSLLPWNGTIGRPGKEEDHSKAGGAPPLPSPTPTTIPVPLVGGESGMRKYFPWGQYEHHTHTHTRTCMALYDAVLVVVAGRPEVSNLCMIKKKKKSRLQSHSEWVIRGGAI